MSIRGEEPRCAGWRGALAAVVLLNAIPYVHRLPRPELHMRLEVALLLGGKGIAVALMR